MRYLVTGGAGFIGSHLSEKLLNDGHEVKIIDDFSTGREENIAHFVNRISLFRGSVTDRNLLRKAIDGVDGVFHQAAIPSVPRSIENPVRTHVSIVDSTLAILEELRVRGGRMVMASSSSIYGNSPVLPKSEEMRPAPISPYAVAKLVAEHYAAVYSNLYGIQTVALRYFNVFGPRQDPRSEYAAVIPRFITAALNGKNPVIYGDGLQTRDFTFVENVVNANILAMKSKVSGEVINIALGSRVSLLDVVEKLSGIVGRKIDIEFCPARQGDVRDSFASVEKAKQLLGYQAVIDFKEGLSRTYEYFRGLSSRGEKR